MSETKTDVYPVGLFSDHRRKRIRYGVRHYLWSYGIKGRRWRAVRNYFNGYLAEHEGCSHNAGRGWTRSGRTAPRRAHPRHRHPRPLSRVVTFYAAQDGIQPEAFEHEWQAAQRAQEMAGNGKPATYWEESET